MPEVSVRYMIDDVPAAVGFYTTLLGFTLEQDASPAFAAVSRDGVRLLLSGEGSSGKRPLADGRRQVPAAGTAFISRSVISSRRSSDCEVPGCHSVRMTSSPGRAARKSSSTIRRVTRSSCFSPDGERPSACLLREC